MTTTSDAIKKLISYRKLIFIVLAAAYLFVYFHRLSLSVVANDLVEEFDTTASVIGLLGSIYFYCYALMQIPAGLLSDSLGPRKVVTASLLVAAIGSIFFGLAPNIPMAFIGRVLVGVGVSVVFIPTMKILSQWYRANEFASMTGILNAIGGIGVLTATLPLALMTTRFGWRLSFELIGLMTLVILALSWLIVRDSPEKKGFKSLAELDQNVPSSESPTERIPLWAGMRKVFKEKYFWPLAIWFFLDCGIFFGFGGLWGGPYLMDVYGLEKAEVGAILSMIAWGMIIGSPIVGFVSDKVLKSRKKVFMICTTGLVAIMALLNVFPSGLPKSVLYLIIFIFAVCSSAIVIIGFTASKELFPVSMAGTSVGAVNLFPFLGGAVYMPLLGWVLDLYPKTAAGVYSFEAYSKMLLVLLVTSVLALLCTFLMKETLGDRSKITSHNQSPKVLK